MPQRILAAAATVGLILAATTFAATAPAGGRLPIVSFTVSQGLPSDDVEAVYADSRGYLWLGTTDGVVRYDGTHFVVYTTADGLPGQKAFSFAEDGARNLWVGTSGGAARLDLNATTARHRFVAATGAKTSQAVFASRSGTLWASCGDDDICTISNGRATVDAAYRAAGGRNINTIADGAGGELWVGTEQGLMRRTRAGAWRHYDVRPHRGTDRIWAVYVDEAGRLWIGDSFGLLVFAPPPDDSDGRAIGARITQTIAPGMPLRLPRSGEVSAISIPGDQAIVRCEAIARTRDGSIWGATDAGLLHVAGTRTELFDAGADGGRVGLDAIAEDAAGNLWVGTNAAGVERITRDGAVTFSRADGLPDERITSIFEPDEHTLCATSVKWLNCFETGILHSGTIVPRGARFYGWGWNQIVTRAPNGEWWVATGEGIVRWPAVRHVDELTNSTPIAVYKARDGVGGDDVFRLWHDSHGNLWAGTFGDEPLARRDAVTGRFESFAPRNGFPKITPSAFAEDRAGNVWIGLYDEGLVRYANGRFERFTANLPRGFIYDLKIDANGALWVAAADGVACIADPAAASLAIRRYPEYAPAFCVTRTADGRIAIGTRRGLELLRPPGTAAAHISADEGLPTSEIREAMLDRDGTLWLGTIRGLSALHTLPRTEPVAPPQPRIMRVEIGGIASPLSELGANAISGLKLEDPQRGMTIAFAAPYFDVAHPLRFEYRLASDRRWTDAEKRAAVSYERLPYGGGIFEVRSVATGGRRSPPARVAFHVIPPFWMRPWFLALAALLAAAVAIALHRLRVEHLLAVQRVRERLATDLHDDLGSSLSRISILSEVAKTSSERDRFLGEIGETARDLIDALGDTVWSIDPRRDNLQSLLARARHFAADMLEAKSIALDVKSPPGADSYRIHPQQRRELYLILKEALNNTAKHAGARHVGVTAAVEGHQLRIEIADDGKGFVPQNGERENGGRGLASMGERAKRAGGTLSIASDEGRGTRLTIAVPM